MLEPVVALVGWTLVMMIWMYATRLPAMHRAKMKLDPRGDGKAKMGTLPPEVRWKADNYNHLMEMPTLFYAVAITLAVLGVSDGAAHKLAWAYVGLRVVHSLVQALTNKIEVRFTLFIFSAFTLIAMTAIAAHKLWA